MFEKSKGHSSPTKVNERIETTVDVDCQECQGTSTVNQAFNVMLNKIGNKL